jgi:NADPH:quinone reductase-like Zn-dependent oxidoreductase/acyl carrier protein
MGSEGAGVVVEVGAGVTGLQCGDRVAGLFAGGFSPVAVTDARLVVPIPDDWSFEVAAGFPVAFVTAYYALRDLADIQPGESVLVHAAAGGVGLAAVQLARLWGARVFATASEWKWPALQERGVEPGRLASSRRLDFARAFSRDVTGGMDVVLNSLAGGFIDASFEVMAEDGRFIELGKTDIRDPSQVPGSYQVYDLAQTSLERVQEILAEVAGLLARGDLLPLPVARWPVAAAPAAFTHMREARHVGKIVLSMPRQWNRDGTVLITGGTGMVGAAVARHVVNDHGMRHLVLAGRRGMAADGAAGLAADLAAAGAQVRVVAADLADAGQVARLVGDIPGEHPLTAVVHCAGVLDDGVVEGLTPQRLAAVFGPKAAAAWHLHQATQDLDLAAFVMCSAGAGVLGSAGQGNYAAANTFLDGLAAYRVARGLPAQALAWGLWAQPSQMTGHLTGQDLARLARAGLEALTAQDGMALFDQARHRPEPLLVPIRLSRATLAASGHPLLRALAPARPAPAPRDHTPAATPHSLTEELAAMPPAQQHLALLTIVRTHTAAVLGHQNAGQIGEHLPFGDLGLDSLTAVELRNRLNTATGLRLPATTAFNHPTPHRLAEYLHEKLSPPDAEAPGREVSRQLTQLNTSLNEAMLHGDLDQAQVAAVLAGMLRRVRGAEGGAVTTVVPQENIEAASDAELFDFIDKNLGPA